MELLSNLTWAWPSESDVAPVTLQSQTYSIRFGWWQVWRLNQALFYRNSKRCCCFYSVILNCLIDNFCSRCSLRLLVLHLKRYEYDNLTEEQAKKQDKVNIKRFIDLSKCQGWVLEVNHLLHICVQLNFDWGGGGGGVGVGVRGETFVSPWVLTIYMGKQEILVGKSNGLRHFVWEPSENMGCDLRQCNFSTLFCLFSTFGTL